MSTAAGQQRRTPPLVVVIVMLALLVGFAAGRLVVPEPNAGPIAAAPGPAPTERDWLPAQDVPGEEIPGLHRLPGSVRVDFDRRATGGVVVTDIDYLAEAPMNQVQRFYRRQIARNGWRLANVSFVRGEWSFLTVRGTTEAVVQIARRGPLVEIDLEQRRPSPLESPAAHSPGTGRNR